MQKIESILEKLFPHRWSLGLLIFILVVILKLSGSSIGMWDVYVPDASSADNGVLLGVNRPIRSDEWCIFTPMALSQYHSGFNVKNSILRGGETDVFMIYGQPVRDWSIIFRPFQIGYLFMDPGKGLAFYWYGKLIALLLISFEFGMLLTKGKKSLSLAYSFLVSFAPVIQWWFSINAFPDMLIYGQGIILLLNGYMRTTSYGRRILYALGLFFCCGAYAMVLYPAWQVPFFYVFLALALGVFFSQWKECVFKKKDIAILSGAALLFIVCMALIAIRSWDAIKAVMDSAYPGARMETGGIGFGGLFRYVANIFFPVREYGLPTNVCELSAFYDCFPLGLIASAWYLYSVRQRDEELNADGLLVGLLSVIFFLGAYIVLGFAPWFSKLTLMSASQAVRSLVALSFANLLLLIRVLALSNETWCDGKGSRVALRLIGAFLLAVPMTYYAKRWLYGDYISNLRFWVCVAVLTVMYFSALWGKRAFCVSACVLSLMIGGTVNPVRYGLTFLENSHLGKAIQSFAAAENGGKWLVVSDNWAAGNYPPIFGAPTLNSTNTYVNRKVWSVLDPDGLYEEVYNRYAHIIVKLTTSENFHAELLQADLIAIDVSVHKLRELGVKYLFSDMDLTAYNTDQMVFREIFSDSATPYRIYHFDVSDN